MAKPKMFVMVGLPGSGKSTIAEKIAQDNECKVWSSDGVREALYGDENIQGDAQIVFDTLYTLISQTLLHNKNVVLDATNINKRDRKRIIERFKNKADLIACVVDVDVDTCKERNSKRDRVVPNEVIDRMAQRFTTPTLDEGWAEIKIEKN